MQQQGKSCNFILFGSLGDLARRKLWPSLYQLDAAGLLGPKTLLIGVARQELKLSEFVEQIKEALNTFIKTPLDDQLLEQFIRRIRYSCVDMAQPEQYLRLTEQVDENFPFISYFATPPKIYGDICHGLQHAGLVRPCSQVVVEKPIGTDYDSSVVINDALAAVFKESQIYRIDHYLGKETVLNLIALRFANALLVNNWDHNTIDHVQITVSEQVGVEGRWGYYDHAGQLRDMVQNHLLQLLALVAMEPPAALDADSIRSEKVKVLKALCPIDSSNVLDKTVRGQYKQGFSNGKAVPGYLTEPDANTSSKTETFVAIKAEVHNWRWAGVPFYLRTGKRMSAKTSELVIYFKALPHNLFHHTYQSLPANKLIIRLQPDEGVEIELVNKVPGLSTQTQLQQTKLDLSFSETFGETRIADAYERLLLEAMLGDQSLFVSREEVEAAWRWIDGIQQAWQSLGNRPEGYPAGSFGPTSAIALLAKDNRSWDEL